MIDNQELLFCVVIFIDKYWIRSIHCWSPVGHLNSRASYFKNDFASLTKGNILVIFLLFMTHMSDDFVSLSV